MRAWKILAVDDESIILSLYREHLERMGHEVVTCAESREALSVYQLHQGRFDLLLTDYRMPYINGIQLTQMLRLFDAELPVLMVTAFCEEVSRSDLHAHQIVCRSKSMRYQDLYQQLQMMQSIGCDANALTI